MKRPSSTEILSICGQLERVAAEIMIERGEAIYIALKDFPAGAPLHDDTGRPAAFAIRIEQNLRRTFDELVADLRA